MEENRNPSTSIDSFIVEEPQEPARSAAGAPAETPAEGAAPISVDELLKNGRRRRGRARGRTGPESPAADVDLRRAASILESLLLVSSEPLSIEKARKLLGELSRDQFEEVCRLLREKYPPESSGILVEKVAKGVQFRTNPANQEHVRKLFDVKPPRFSRAALETVAIIAYKQPLTRQEIEQIRGVDCAGSLKTLMDRRLVRVVGKKDVPGEAVPFRDHAGIHGDLRPRIAGRPAVDARDRGVPFLFHRHARGIREARPRASVRRRERIRDGRRPGRSRGGGGRRSGGIRCRGGGRRGCRGRGGRPRRGRPFGGRTCRRGRASFRPPCRLSA